MWAFVGRWDKQVVSVGKGSEPGIWDDWKWKQFLTRECWYIYLVLNTKGSTAWSRDWNIRSVCNQRANQWVKAEKSSFKMIISKIYSYNYFCQVFTIVDIPKYLLTIIQFQLLFYPHSSCLSTPSIFTSLRAPIRSVNIYKFSSSTNAIIMFKHNAILRSLNFVFSC